MAPGKLAIAISLPKLERSIESSGSDWLHRSILVCMPTVSTCLVLARPLHKTTGLQEDFNLKYLH